MALGRLEPFFTTEYWNIGVIAAPVAEIVAGIRAGRRLPPVRWFAPAPCGRFRADPFCWQHDGQWFVAAEDMDYLGTARGRIVVTTLDDQGRPGRWRPAIETPGHLSYPCPFRHDGAWYLAPESWEAGRLEAWRLGATPWHWQRVTPPLLPDFAAVDATLTEHDGRWWLFCTDRRHQPDRDLLLFYSDGPFGPWQPHPANPIVSTRRGARPAGPLFTLDGVLHRPGQDNSRGYGGAVIVHRIDTLSPTAYRETEVAVLSPDPAGPWPDGLHTLCPAGALTLVDGKHRRPHWYSLPLKLWTVWRNRRRRGRLQRGALPHPPPGP
jgi:hypothetical protein